MSIDKRVLKTRKQLKNALLVLLKETTFENITVTAICELALVNRITFYAHYKDKYYLFDELINDEIEGVIQKSNFSTKLFTGKAEAIEAILNLIEVSINECAEKKDVLLALLNYENSYPTFIFNSKISTHIEKLLRKTEQITTPKYPLEMISSFACGGICTSIFKWLKNNKAVPKTQFINDMKSFMLRFLELSLF